MQTEFITDDLLTINLYTLHNYSNILYQICQEELEGIVIKKVFSVEQMKKLASNIQSIETGFHRTRFGKTLGLNLSDKSSGGLSYFREANQFRKMLDQQFSDGFEGRLISILSKISGERVVELPQENGNEYTPVTLRFVPPNQPGIIAHTDSEFIYGYGYSYLHEIANISDCLSFFIVVNKPEQGGELIFYDLPLSSQQLKAMKNGRNKFIREVKKDIENCPYKCIDLDEGDMVVFKSSTLIHKIVEGYGNKTRITIGGFLAISHDDKKVYYWS